MTDKLKQTIKEELSKLPKELETSINLLDWVKITEEVGTKYLLNDSEINALQAETLLILVGITDLDDCAQNIENNVETSKNEAEKISEELIEKVFNPVYENLKNTIKGKLDEKNINWKQSINFVLSGGNYSIFLEEKADENSPDKLSNTITLNNLAGINNIKNKFNSD